MNISDLQLPSAMRAADIAIVDISALGAACAADHDRHVGLAAIHSELTRRKESDSSPAMEIGQAGMAVLDVIRGDFIAATPAGRCGFPLCPSDDPRGTGPEERTTVPR